MTPPPAVTKYPSFLNAIFDPNWVDFGPDKIAGNADDTYNGPKSPIKPVFRAVGVKSISSASNLWVILQLVVFDKGTKLPNLPAFDPAYGYPSVVVLQTSSAAGSATPPAPSAVTDFCTPLKTVNVMYGVTQDNPDTPANEGGIPIRTMPAAGTQIISIGYNASQRDPDGDGYENSLDPCPFNTDTVWDPRNPGQGDSDHFAGVPLPDGIPDTCDPTPNEATADPPASQPTDHDGDGFPNRTLRAWTRAPIQRGGPFLLAPWPAKARTCRTARRSSVSRSVRSRAAGIRTSCLAPAKRHSLPSSAVFPKRPQ